MSFISFKELKEALAISVQRKRDVGLTTNYRTVASAEEVD